MYMVPIMVPMCMVILFSWFLHVRDSCVHALCVYYSYVHEVFDMGLSPCGLTLTWWGCCGLCLWCKPAKLAHSFWFYSCVCFCLYGPFNCILFHKFWQLSTFSLCSYGLIGPFNYISMSLWKSPSALIYDIILCGWLGLKHQLTKKLTNMGLKVCVSLPQAIIVTQLSADCSQVFYTW